LNQHFDPFFSMKTQHTDRKSQLQVDALKCTKERHIARCVEPKQCATLWEKVVAEFASCTELRTAMNPGRGTAFIIATSNDVVLQIKESATNCSPHHNDVAKQRR
jgi:hypothetical protein